MSISQRTRMSEKYPLLSLGMSLGNLLKVTSLPPSFIVLTQLMRFLPLATVTSLIYKKKERKRTVLPTPQVSVHNDLSSVFLCYFVFFSQKLSSVLDLGSGKTFSQFTLTIQDHMIQEDDTGRMLSRWLISTLTEKCQLWILMQSQTRGRLIVSTEQQGAHHCLFTSEGTAFPDVNLEHSPHIREGYYEINWWANQESRLLCFSLDNAQGCGRSGRELQDARTALKGPHC